MGYILRQSYDSEVKYSDEARARLAADADEANKKHGMMILPNGIEPVYSVNCLRLNGGTGGFVITYEAEPTSYAEIQNHETVVASVVAAINENRSYLLPVGFDLVRVP